MTSHTAVPPARPKEKLRRAGPTRRDVVPPRDDTAQHSSSEVCSEGKQVSSTAPQPAVRLSRRGNAGKRHTRRPVGRFNLLLIDDDRSTRALVNQAIEGEPFDVHIAATVKEALQAIQHGRPDLVLVDTAVADHSLPELLQELRGSFPGCPLVVITESPDANTAIEVMQIGVSEYIVKPLDLQGLRKVVDHAIQLRQSPSAPVRKSPRTAPKCRSEDSLIGCHPTMVEVYKAIGRVAKHDVSVLIRGESGTGKELVARAIHQHSRRSHQPYLAINCAALPEELLESELFGHERGAFTDAIQERIGKFEQCHRGTIFLDEIGDMAPGVQGKVLRLLQQQSFERVGGNKTITTDVRIIAATNRNLETRIISGQFRTDLLYRLNGYSIHLPPLRDRASDIPLLVSHFFDRMGRKLNRQNVTNFSAEALALLMNYPWPGNVRELEAVVRHGLLNVAVGPTIVVDCLPPEIRNAISRQDQSPQPGSSARTLWPSSDLAAFVEQEFGNETTDLYAASIAHSERYLLTRVLQHAGGNQSQAAKILGISRGKLADRIWSFGIQLESNVTLGLGNATENPHP